MPLEIGTIEAIFRYPVKSMRGDAVDAATLGWHGIDGDRRIAIRRRGVGGGFPWLSASSLPDLINFTPLRREEGNGDALPTHVRAPEGQEMPLFGEALAADIERRYGSSVEMMQLRNGIFDESDVSVIATGTVKEICQLAGAAADVRRFRPNIAIRSVRAVPFEEDDWVGGLLMFGDADDAPAVTITMRDVRCSMVNLDPDGGDHTPEMLKAVVRVNQNHAGVYGTVVRIGRLAVGQSVVLHRY